MSPVAVSVKAASSVKSSNRPSLHTDEKTFGRRNEDGSYKLLEQPLGTRRKLRIIGIGAGASGINLAYVVHSVQNIQKSEMPPFNSYKIKSHMQDVEFIAYEKNADIGGTWLENRYPGCACDTNSHTYAYTYYPNPNWSAVYSTSKEIQSYLADVVQHFGLSCFFNLNHEIVAAEWDEEMSRWLVTVRRGGDPETDFLDWCDVLINGSGLLNHWKWPSIAGLESFEGTKMHTADWPEGADLAGKKVALVGIGSSAIQVLPEVRKIASSVDMYIRSKTWITPRGPIEPYSDEERKAFQDDPQLHKEYCKQLEHTANLRFRYIHKNSKEQSEMRELWGGDMKNELAGRPDLAEKLVPEFGAGCRRPTPGPGFLAALQEENVNPVFSPITEITKDGVVTADGEHHPCDVLICATGFDVSFKPRFPVIGRGGVDLRQKWSKLPQAYLSMFTSEFPNYITMLGPGAPSAQGSIIVSIERISDYIIKLLHRLQTEPILSFEVKPEVLKDLAEHAEAQLATTVWADSCSSWFKNGTTNGPLLALHPGGRLHFFATLMDPRFEDFNYTYSNNRFAHWGNGYALREVENKDITWYMDFADGLKIFEY